MAYAEAPTRKLLHGAEIPVIGLGTYPLRGAESAAQVVTAIEAGYRLIDTAEAYRNEDGVGQGIRDSGIDRAEVFLTTKFDRLAQRGGGRAGVRDQLGAAGPGLQRRHDKTATQVVLRWHLQMGFVDIPKSADPGRIAENIDVFDFELTAAEIDQITALDRGEAGLTDSDVFGH